MRGPLTIAYVHWDALPDACSRCRAHDGLHWVPTHGEVAGPPLGECLHRRGCQCACVYVLDLRYVQNFEVAERIIALEVGVAGRHDVELERGALDLGERIARAGGLVRQEEAFRLADALEAQRYQDQLAEQCRRARAAHPGAALAEQAQPLEKADPAEAVRLYREAIRAQSQLCHTSHERSDWTVFPRLYSRLSLVLERQGRLQDALGLLDAYANSGCDALASKSIREAIAKRRARIRRRLGLPRTDPA